VPSPKDDKSTNKENNVTTTDAPTTEAPPTEAAATEATAAAAAKKSKDPVPEGFITPVEFAKQLGKRLGGDETTVRPQIIYGYIRNAKDFPFKQNTDGRFIVDLEAGNKWIDAKNARKAEKEAKKAAEAKAAAEKAAATPAATTSPTS
jgi:hypothetical protein